MEQPTQLTIIRTDTVYRFRLDLPEGQPQPTQEYITEVTPEVRERLRRALQAATQQMQAVALADVRRQTMKLSAVNDAFLNLGRFLFDTLLPPPIQEALRHLDTPLIFNTNTPEIPWELLFEGSAKSGRFLSQHLSMGRQVASGRDEPPRLTMPDRSTRKVGRRETQGLTVLFLVNPTGDHPVAEEEVATLCTTLPESVSRMILYRQQANQLEVRMRMGADLPQVLHYTGPYPTTTAGEPILALGGSSRLDSNTLEQIFQPLPRRPLVFLSFHDDERQVRNGSSISSQQEREESMERMAGNLIAAGAGAVLTIRWPANTQRTREFAILFYQEVADGVSLGEAMRRARSSMVQHRPEDMSWMTYVLYGDPTQRLVTVSASSKERSNEPRFDAFDESQMISPILSSSNSLERRFLQEVLGLALAEARRMHKDYLGTPHLFIALTKLDGGCTQDALQNLPGNFSPKQVRDVIRLALGSGKASSDTPILPTRRCKEILQTAERIALESGSALIDERSIAQAVLSEGDGVTHELLTKLGINPAQLIELILMSNARSLLELVPSVSANPAVPIELPVGISPEGVPKGGNSLLDRLGHDLTKQAALRELPPLIGR